MTARSSGSGWRLPGRLVVIPVLLLLVMARSAWRWVEGNKSVSAEPMARPHKPAPLWTGSEDEVMLDQARREKARLAKATERFLADRGRGADNLAIAFMMTRQVDYLDEALAADPNNIMALFAGVGTGPVERRAELVQRLRRLEPRNSLWCVEEALESIRGGDSATAIAALRTALTLDSLHDPFPRFLGAEEAFRRDYLHQSFRESMAEAWSTRGLALVCHFYSIQHHLTRELEAACASGLPEKVREFAALGLDLALLEARQGSVEAARGGANQEDQLLRLIERDPAGAQILDRPLKQYRQEVIADVRLAGTLAKFRTEFIETAPESELREYVEQRTRVGEVVVLQELMARQEAQRVNGGLVEGPGNQAGPTGGLMGWDEVPITTSSERVALRGREARQAATWLRAASTPPPMVQRAER